MQRFYNLFRTEADFSYFDTETRKTLNNFEARRQQLLDNDPSERTPIINNWILNARANKSKKQMELIKYVLETLSEDEQSKDLQKLAKAYLEGTHLKGRKLSLN